MRVGVVRGRVVLSRSVASLRGTTLLLVEPVTAANLAARNGRGGGKTIVVADRLSPADGQLIGVVEGREAANAYTEPTPVDAYCALIVNDYTFQPPAATPAATGDKGQAKASQGPAKAGPHEPRAVEGRG